MPRALPLLAAFAALAASGCAHAPAQPAAPAPTWPSDGMPLARWAGSFPRAEPPPRSWPRRALDAVLGIDPQATSLARPFAVAARGAELFVADPDAAVVLRVDWRSGDSSPVECSRHRWRSPIALAASPEALYVADGGAGVVARLREGRCELLGQGALERPTGLAASRGLLYVVDPPRHQVVAFDDTGREVRRFGSRGEGPGQLHFPTAIAAEPDGSLLVVDTLNFRVARFSPEGAFLTAFGEPGEELGQLGRPKGVAVAAGRLYVTDAQHDAILVFTQRGVFEYVLGSSGGGRGELLMPAGVAAEGGLLFVANSQNQRVDVYELLGGAS